MDLLNTIGDPEFARDLSVNLISDVISTLLLVVIIGGLYSAWREWLKDRKRREFVLRFLRVCDAFNMRFLDLLESWDREDKGYRRSESDQSPIQRVLWRMSFLKDTVETATKVSDLASSVLELDDIKDQMEVLSGLWRVNAELDRASHAQEFEPTTEGRVLPQTWYQLNLIFYEKMQEFEEFWETQKRLKKKWKYKAYARRINDQYSKEFQWHAEQKEDKTGLQLSANGRKRTFGNR